jgi:TrfA protein
MESTVAETNRLTAFCERQKKIAEERAQNKDLNDKNAKRDLIDSRIRKLKSEHKLAGVQMPLWDPSIRGIPNSLARSALFSCSQLRGERKFVKDLLVATVANLHIKYRGQELNQDDFTVFMQLVHLARGQTLSQDYYVDFTANSFINAVGWTRHTRSYIRLKETLLRLQATALQVLEDLGDQGDRAFSGSLVRKFEYETPAGASLRKWRVYLEAGIVALFDDESYTRVYFQQRLITRGDLAQWLHSFYSTHREPFAMRVSTIRDLSGSLTKKLFHFRGSLENALNELQIVGFLDGWNIDENDLVHVKRIPIKQMLERPIDTN